MKCLLLLLFIISLPLKGENFFTSCRFHYGAGGGRTAEELKEIDYITTWAGWSEDFQLGGYFSDCKKNNKTPVIMAYIVAFTIKRDLKVADCNMGTPNLCQKGADYIRKNKERLLKQYAKYAKGAAASFGTQEPMIWLLEPDWIQYAEEGQEGGPISHEEMGQFTNQIIDTILAYTPNSLLSVDISPWKKMSFYTSWYGKMDMKKISFINTSGGSANADNVFIRESSADDYPKWETVYKTWGKPLIADVGYGVGGAATGYDLLWMKSENLSKRIPEGVLAVTQANPGPSFAADIQSIRSKLPTPPTCPGMQVRAYAGTDKIFTLPANQSTLTFTLDGSASTSPLGSISNYTWIYNNKTIGNQAILEYTLGSGNHLFSLIVTDSKNKSDTDEVVISIANYTTSKFKNRWQQNILSEQNGKAIYVPEATSRAQEWLLINRGTNTYEIKNSNTNNYLNTSGATETVLSSPKTADSLAFLWKLHPTPDGYLRIESIQKSNFYMHIENQTGKIQLGKIAEGWQSAQWDAFEIPYFDNSPIYKTNARKNPFQFSTAGLFKPDPGLHRKINLTLLRSDGKKIISLDTQEPVNIKQALALSESGLYIYRVTDRNYIFTGKIYIE